MAETRPQICVLEDDAAVRDSLRWMLERNGFSPRIFSSPNEFLLSPGFDRYDCLVIDLGLPGMSGLELLPKAKAARPDVPIIMITAYGDAETKRTALKNGAEAILTKPIDFGILRNEIETRIQRAA